MNDNTLIDYMMTIENGSDGRIYIPNSIEEFDKIMSQEPKKHSDYKSSKLIKFGNLARIFRKYLSD